MNDPMLMAPSFQRCFGAVAEMFHSLLEASQFLGGTYEASSNKDSQVVKQTGGTGYYFRALIYYHLVTRWGGAPILRKRTYDVVCLSHPKPMCGIYNKEDWGKAERFTIWNLPIVLRIFKCM